MPAAEFHLEPVGLLQPERRRRRTGATRRRRSWRTRRGRTRHRRCGNPTASAATRTVTPRRRARSRSRRARPTGPSSRRAGRRRERRTLAASPSMRSKPAARIRSARSSNDVVVDRLEAEERRVVGAPGSTNRRCALPSSRQVSVPDGGLAGHEPDDLTEERAQDGRVGDLDAQVGEFEVAVHDAQPYGMTITVATITFESCRSKRDAPRSSPHSALSSRRSSCTVSSTDRFDHWAAVQVLDVRRDLRRTPRGPSAVARTSTPRRSAGFGNRSAKPGPFETIDRAGWCRRPGSTARRRPLRSAGLCLGFVGVRHSTHNATYCACVRSTVRQIASSCSRLRFASSSTFRCTLRPRVTPRGSRTWRGVDAAIARRLRHRTPICLQSRRLL